MKVKKELLLIFACFIWIVAGANVLKIGISAYTPFFSVPNLLISVVVFLLFEHLVFSRLVKKHVERISNYEEEYQFFYKFFDLKSFIIMAGMMSGGIFFRKIELFPNHFIAVFYSGLGAALLIAGILFGINYIKMRKESKLSKN